MAQSPTYLRTLSATTFDGIAATLGTTAPWHERCDTTARLIIAALHDVHPDKVDVVQVNVTRPNGGASIAYRIIGDVAEDREHLPEWVKDSYFRR